MTIATSTETPSFRKRSKAKIWLRTGILAIFATIFGISLYHDIASGRFQWYWGLIAYLICFPIGFAMRNLVPMQVHLTSKHVTMSFDKIYFAVILALVIGKLVAGRFFGLTVLADVIICAILGLMTGRLGGIGVRVRGLKREHGFLSPQENKQLEAEGGSSE
jgi:hypothetical protein